METIEERTPEGAKARAALYLRGRIQGIMHPVITRAALIGAGRTGAMDEEIDTHGLRVLAESHDARMALAVEARDKVIAAIREVLPGAMGEEIDMLRPLADGPEAGKDGLLRALDDFFEAHDGGRDREIERDRRFDSANFGPDGHDYWAP